MRSESHGVASFAFRSLYGATNAGDTSRRKARYPSDGPKRMRPPRVVKPPSARLRNALFQLRLVDAIGMLSSVVMNPTSGCLAKIVCKSVEPHLPVPIKKIGRIPQAYRNGTATKVLSARSWAWEE